MEQRSKEWFEARVGVITGSRVGSILGVNPFQKEAEVLRSMVREFAGAESEFKGNAATDHGERMESVALAYYEKLTGNKVDQTGLVKHDEYDWLGASPDGLIGLDGGLEIKCPYWAKEPYSVHDKPSYFAQCQHVMEVCDLEWMDFFCYISEDVYLLERIERDRDWFENVFPKLEAFQANFRLVIADPESVKKFTTDAVASLDDPQAVRMAELYRLIQSNEIEISPLKKEFDALKKDLGGRHGSFITNGVKVNRVEKKGAVDNQSLYKDLDVDGLLSQRGKTIDDYRKEAVVSFVVTSVEE
jgi:putative phage-type endonuclease